MKKKLKDQWYYVFYEFLFVHLPIHHLYQPSMWLFHFLVDQYTCILYISEAEDIPRYENGSLGTAVAALGIGFILHLFQISSKTCTERYR